MKKIILDTDIGSDIDDALCLTYLLKQPECELLGITTVSGMADKRAELASAICTQAKREIPIYIGAEAPLMTKQRQPEATQAKRLCNWSHKTEFPDLHAVSFMRETILKAPGEVTLLAIGPLTNVALLFSVYPETQHLLKSLVIMNGMFYGNPHGEWNVICDPHASAICYGADVPELLAVGLDVTTQVVIQKQDIGHQFDAEILKPSLDFAGEWFKERDKITFHDPLAGAVIFDSEICSFETGTVMVELQDKGAIGVTRFHTELNGRHKVASTVDKSRFFQHYFDTVAE